MFVARNKALTLLLYFSLLSWALLGLILVFGCSFLFNSIRFTELFYTLIWLVSYSISVNCFGQLFDCFVVGYVSFAQDFFFKLVFRISQKRRVLVITVFFRRLKLVCYQTPIELRAIKSHLVVYETRMSRVRHFVFKCLLDNRHLEILLLNCKT